jgi:hypothetical protein
MKPRPSQAICRRLAFEMRNTRLQVRGKRAVRRESMTHVDRM